jgi:hypothetical protein
MTRLAACARVLIFLALPGAKVFTGGGSSCVAGMTHDILQTDIELAKELIESNRPDAEVALALTRRGLDSAVAGRLVEDLRNGRRVQPQMAVEWVTRRRSGSRSSGEAGHDRPSAQPSPSRSTSEKRSNQRRPSRGARKKAKENAIVWVVAVILACLVVVTAIVIFKHSQRTKDDGETPALASKPAPAASSKPQAPTGPVVLEIQADGLHLGGTLLTRDAAWNHVAKFLGAATRTNRLAGGNRMIYAYDQHGILVYAEQGAGTDSIVLDFDGLGGTNGAASPFQGTFKIEDRPIKADTDTMALSAIKQLGLKEPGADAGIFGGQYNGLELIFAYLKTPKRLSLVEISLK